MAVTCSFQLMDYYNLPQEDDFEIYILPEFELEVKVKKDE